MKSGPVQSSIQDDVGDADDVEKVKFQDMTSRRNGNQLIYHNISFTTYSITDGLLHLA